MQSRVPAEYTVHSTCSVLRTDCEKRAAAAAMPSAALGPWGQGSCVRELAGAGSRGPAAVPRERVGAGALLGCGHCNGHLSWATESRLGPWAGGNRG